MCLLVISDHSSENVVNALQAKKIVLSHRYITNSNHSIVCHFALFSYRSEYCTIQLLK